MWARDAGGWRLTTPEAAVQRWRCPARSTGREAATRCCVSAPSNLLNRSVTEGPQNCIDARLIASPLCLEPFEHILIHAQRNGCFGR